MKVMNKQEMEESNFLNEYKKAGWKLCSKILGIKEEETTTMNKQELIGVLEGLEGDSFIEKYNEGYDQAVRDCVIAAKQLDEPKKVIVPQVVADWIKYAKRQGYGFMQAYDPIYMSYPINDSLDKWIENKEETFARAWLDGYEVEKEPAIHELKIQPTYFEDVKVGKKTFEIRKNDRGYKEGDILILNEYTCGSFTGRKCKVLVNYITDYEQKDSYVVLGIIRFNRPEDVRESRS